jgi:hypothetical protein
MGSSGCGTIRITDPARTATEQYLLNEATRRSIERLSAAPLRDRLIFVDGSFLIDESSQFNTARAKEEFVYAVAELRARLLEAGARLTNEREKAEAIVEVRAVGIGIDRYETLIGIPSVVLQEATGAQAALATPELALFKKIRQQGYASIAYVAWWRDTGEMLTTSGPHVAKTQREDFWILGWGPRTVGNVPPAED